MSRRAWIWIVVAWSTASSCAEAGVVRGTLRLPQGHLVEQARPEDAVIYVEAVPERLRHHFSRVPREPRLVQERSRYVPRVLPVVVGTTVRLQNHDRIYHRAFSVSPAKRFELDTYAPGESRLVTFDRVGVVRLYCEIDRNMSGYVVVLPHRAFTQPDSTGAFILPKLPAGSYTLRMWHPALRARSRKIEIPGRGGLTLDWKL